MLLLPFAWLLAQSTRKQRRNSLRQWLAGCFQGKPLSKSSFMRKIPESMRIYAKQRFTLLIPPSHSMEKEDSSSSASGSDVDVDVDENSSSSSSSHSSNVSAKLDRAKNGGPLKPEKYPISRPQKPPTLERDGKRTCSTCHNFIPVYNNGQESHKDRCNEKCNDWEKCPTKYLKGTTYFIYNFSLCLKEFLRRAQRHLEEVQEGSSEMEQGQKEVGFGTKENCF
jgi:hypothetical protein